MRSDTQHKYEKECPKNTVPCVPSVNSLLCPKATPVIGSVGVYPDNQPVYCAPVRKLAAPAMMVSTQQVGGPLLLQKEEEYRHKFMSKMEAEHMLDTKFEKSAATIFGQQPNIRSLMDWRFSAPCNSMDLDPASCKMAEIEHANMNAQRCEYDDKLQICEPNLLNMRHSAIVLKQRIYKQKKAIESKYDVLNVIYDSNKNIRHESLDMMGNVADVIENAQRDVARKACDISTDRCATTANCTVSKGACVPFFCENSTSRAECENNLSCSFENGTCVSRSAHDLNTISNASVRKEVCASVPRYIWDGQRCHDLKQLTQGHPKTLAAGGREEDTTIDSMVTLLRHMVSELIRMQHVERELNDIISKYDQKYISMLRLDSECALRRGSGEECHNLPDGTSRHALTKGVTWGEEGPRQEIRGGAARPDRRKHLRASRLVERRNIRRHIIRRFHKAASCMGLGVPNQ